MGKVSVLIRRKENVFQILIVEDDKELSQLFQKVLEKNGYQVKSASDGAQALEVLDKEYIDLIISDIMMPVMDGYELVSELRENLAADGLADGDSVVLTLPEVRRTLSASAPDGGAKKGSNNPLQIHQMENEMDRKPGSVLNDDLSRPAIADRLVPPSGHASSAVRPI